MSNGDNRLGKSLGIIEFNFGNSSKAVYRKVI
jgi:hypothetical protein